MRILLKKSKLMIFGFLPECETHGLAEAINSLTEIWWQRVSHTFSATWIVTKHNPGGFPSNFLKSGTVPVARVGHRFAIGKFEGKSFV